MFVVTAWARNLPPDEFPDEDDHQQPNNNPPRPNPTQRRRSIASILKQTASFSSVPTTPTTPSAAGPSTSPRKPTIRRTSASSGETDPTHSSPDLQTPLEPPKPAFHQSDTRRPSSAQGGQAGGWWTFTLPTKHLHHQADLEKGKMRAEEEEHEEDGQGGDKDEKRRKLNKAKARSEYHKQLTATMVTQLAPPGVFSMNQTQVSPRYTAPFKPAEVAQYDSLLADTRVVCALDAVPPVRVAAG